MVQRRCNKTDVLTISRCFIIRPLNRSRRNKGIPRKRVCCAAAARRAPKVINSAVNLPFQQMPGINDTAWPTRQSDAARWKNSEVVRAI